MAMTTTKADETAAELLQYYQEELHKCQEKLVDRGSLLKRNLELLDENAELKVELNEAYARIDELERKGRAP